MSAIASTLDDYWNEQKNGKEHKDLQETRYSYFLFALKFKLDEVFLLLFSVRLV